MDQKGLLHHPLLLTAWHSRLDPSIVLLFGPCGCKSFPLGKWVCHGDLNVHQGRRSREGGNVPGLLSPLLSTLLEAQEAGAASPRQASVTPLSLAGSLDSSSEFLRPLEAFCGGEWLSQVWGWACWMLLCLLRPFCWLGSLKQPLCLSSLSR